MLDLLKKLNYAGQNPLVLLNAPTDFVAALRQTLPGVPVLTDVPNGQPIAFAMAFVTQQTEINSLTPPLVAQLDGDGLLWFAYPKGTSKNYRCNFNRDTGWQVLGEHGFEGVRQIAIDPDWTALRFRRADYIKSMKRDTKRAMSTVGKTKVNPAAASS